jgi:hypothetical protein
MLQPHLFPAPPARGNIAENSSVERSSFRGADQIQREHRLVAQKKTAHGAPWTKEDVRELRAHSKARTPLPEIAKKMKRTERALRRKAGILGIGLGHRR